MVEVGAEAGSSLDSIKSRGLDNSDEKFHPTASFARFGSRDKRIRIARDDAKAIVQRLEIRFQLRTCIKTQRSRVLLEDVGKVLGQLFVPDVAIQEIIFLEVEDVRLRDRGESCHHIGGPIAIGPD